MSASQGEASTGPKVDDQTSRSTIVLPNLLFKQVDTIQHSIKIDLNNNQSNVFFIISCLMLNLTFMQISNPNLGDTPALLTRTSILFPRNLSA